MYKNGKMYNLEVLYDEISNTVYYFEYARKAMGNGSLTVEYYKNT